MLALTCHTTVNTTQLLLHDPGLPWHVTAFVLQVDKCDAEVRLTVDADGRQACKPTQNVKEALAKLDSLLQS